MVRVRHRAVDVRERRVHQLVVAEPRRVAAEAVGHHGVRRGVDLVGPRREVVVER